MANPIQYTPKPHKTGPDAHEELERLLQTAHEHGALRFANDLLASNNQWMQVLVDGLNQRGARNAVQNLAMLLMMLSRIEPNQLCKVLFAAEDGFDRIANVAPDARSGHAPGIKGAYKMLHDDRLWRAAWPLMDALRVFRDGLDRDIDTPISAFSGKQTRKR